MGEQLPERGTVLTYARFDLGALHEENVRGMGKTAIYWEGVLRAVPRRSQNISKLPGVLYQSSWF